MECLFADFDFPEQGITSYTTHGNSPRILWKFIQWLDQLDPVPEQLDLALFLFNNEILYNALAQLAKKGCHITIYSIPLEGYDSNARYPIYNPDTRQATQPLTKYEIAKQLYDQIIKREDNQLELRIVSKMYIRSKAYKDFSRGKWPYALHCKTFHLTQSLKDGSQLHYTGITSSNLAVRDESKIELYSLYKLTSFAELQNCSSFFGGLYSNSTNIIHFTNPPDENASEEEIYRYYNKQLAQETFFLDTPPLSQLLYSAPFLENSPRIIENILREKLSQAKERVYICAEHLSAYHCPVYRRGSRTKNMREGILFTLLERIKHEKNPPHVSFIAQTSALLPGCRVPENPHAFKEFEKEVLSLIKAGKNVRFVANELFHAKIYVIDDNIVITTDNITPTQFDYIKECRFTPNSNPNYSISGVFCEYGVFAFIESIKPLADKLVACLDKIITSSNRALSLASLINK